MKAPCKDCKERHPCCHDHCEKYQAFRQERLAYYDAHLKESKESNAFYENTLRLKKKADHYRRGKKI